MIFDSVDHIETYRNLNPQVFRGLELLKQDFSQISVGRYNVDADLFYMVQEYETQLDNLPESHKKFIDIQCILSGTEVIAVHNPRELEVAEAHPERDLWLYQRKEGNRIAVTAGKFMVLWPQDAHTAALSLGQPEKVRKVVVKIRINET